MFLLLTGASAVGKSTVRRLVAPELAPRVRAVELAEVVAIPATYDLTWRQRSTEEAVELALALQEEGRHLLLAGDPVAPAEVLATPSADRLDGFAACLLDCAPAEQERRLRERGDPAELLPAHLGFAEWMRDAARDPRGRLDVLAAEGWDQMRWDRVPDAWEVPEIDTTELPPERVAEEVLAWVRGELGSD